MAEWQGDPAPLSTAWATRATAALPEAMRPIAKLLLLTATATSQVTDADVRAARDLLDTDEKLLVAVAWAAFLAARRVGEWTWRACQQGAAVDQ